MNELLLRRRVASAKSLPYDAEIQYLRGTGTQWIDTGIIPKTNTKAQFKFMNSVVTGDCIFGYMDANEIKSWRFFNYSSKAYLDLPGANNTRNRIYGGTVKAGVIYNLEIGNIYVKNLSTGTNIISGTASPSFVGINTIRLNYGGYGIPSQNYFYYVKIFEGSALVRDMIPVRVGQTGYMYDKVSEQLFGNAGTGNFILGPDL